MKLVASLVKKCPAICVPRRLISFTYNIAATGLYPEPLQSSSHPFTAYCLKFRSFITIRCTPRRTKSFLATKILYVLPPIPFSLTRSPYSLRWRIHTPRLHTLQYTLHGFTLCIYSSPFSRILHFMAYQIRRQNIKLLTS
jgi:hypothetical protein